MRERKTKNTMTSAVSQERYFYLWPRFSIKYWKCTSKDSFLMTLQRVAALLELKVTFCSLVRRELCGLQRAALFSAPCLLHQDPIHKDFLLRENLKTLNRRDLCNLRSREPCRSPKCAFNQAPVINTKTHLQNICVLQHIELCVFVVSKRVSLLWVWQKWQLWCERVWFWLQRNFYKTVMTLFPYLPFQMFFPLSDFSLYSSLQYLGTIITFYVTFYKENLSLHLTLSPFRWSTTHANC